MLESFAGLIVRMGDVGAGQRAKIVNNALMAANMGLAHAAMEAGRALDLDDAPLRDLIKASSGAALVSRFMPGCRPPAPLPMAHRCCARMSAC
ncbi:NAD-binding protein [Sphingobium scionense]